jgi:4-amino-4-deoxy-L-arabinose transferase-like glycosyltransferase
MNDHHWLSLRRMSDKMAFVLLLGVGCAGLFFVTTPFAFLLLAVPVGILLGIADAWYFLKKRWARFISIIVVVMLAMVAPHQFRPGDDSWVRFSIGAQFLVIAIGTGFLVVEFKERISRSRKSANKTSEPTPGDVTPAADAPVAPPPGAAHS